jgi:hypothetical protein
MKDEIFSGLVAQLEERFQEMDSNITTVLLDTDEEYAALRSRQTELEERFPFIETAMEGKGSLLLNAVEHAGLVEYLSVVNEIENRERLNLYYAGHRDCFTYLKRVGLL